MVSVAKKIGNGPQPASRGIWAAGDRGGRRGMPVKGIEGPGHDWALSDLREEICRFGKSIYDRGLTFGARGETSAPSWRTAGCLIAHEFQRWISKPDPAALSKLDDAGTSGVRQTAVQKFHAQRGLWLRFAATRVSASFVHLHSTHSVAVSCLADVDTDNVLPPLTAYYVLAPQERQANCRWCLRLRKVRWPATRDKALAAAIEARCERIVITRKYCWITGRAGRCFRTVCRMPRSMRPRS